MRALLGPRLTDDLDAEVERTLDRVELRSALDILGAWNATPVSEAAADVPPELPVEPAIGELVEDDAPEEPVPPGFTRRQIVWGNVSVLALGLAIGLFTVWRFYFQFPLDSEIRLFGWNGLQMSWVDGLKNVLMGSLGLSVIFSLKNLGSLISQFYWPFERLEGAEIKKLLATPGTAIFSVLVLILFAAVCSTNVSAKLVLDSTNDGLEVVAHLERRRGLFFYRPRDEGRDGGGPWSRVRLDEERPSVRLAFQGFSAQGLVLLRDRYGLVTVDAMHVRRSFWRIHVEPLTLEAQLPPGMDKIEKRDYVSPASLNAPMKHQLERWSLELRDPLRWNRLVFHRITDETGQEWGRLKEDGRLFLEGADRHHCPTRRREQPKIDAFWRELCEQRRAFADSVHSAPEFVTADERVVSAQLSSYDVNVLFTEGRLTGSSPGLSCTTREAVRLTAIHHDSAKKPTTEPTTAERGADP
jgi:hypothetical protein